MIFAYTELGNIPGTCSRDEQAVVTADYSRVARESESLQKEGASLKKTIELYRNFLAQAAPNKQLPATAALKNRSSGKPTQTLAKQKGDKNSGKNTREILDAVYNGGTFW